ncbi:UNVERIFIED_CONTAM: hypothetical protein PYX00_010321 [Menopon gallinae]|uniref:NADH dehydrogenase [ubiquinone] 1 alpha subcomplex assembly factor 3 n=1 Tax=Menopon gallinae TaxID=328185 RepID=A0AAW2HF66_9NEOP
MRAFRRIVPHAGVRDHNSKDSLLKLLPDSWAKPLNKSYFGETYEGTGKTTGYIVNKRDSPVFCVDYVGTSGFQMTNGWVIKGPLIIFPHRIFSWKVKSAKDINVDSLAFFSVLQPQVECLFIGWGDFGRANVIDVRGILKACRSLKLKFEVSDTESAVSAFNFCSLDNRYVAAAVIPPEKLIIPDRLKLSSPSSGPNASKAVAKDRTLQTVK